MQVEPQTTLPLVYKINDPALFANTYYVRAVIRDTLSGTTLETINLTRSSDGSRYTGQTSAPADGAGTGKHIDITVSVYSDSGYTTYVDGLAEIIDKYVIKAQAVSFGGSGGANIDYQKIKEIVVKVVDEKLGEKETVEDEGVDLSPVISEIQSLKKIIKERKEFKETDLSEIVQGLFAIKSLITNLPKPPKETDLSPLYPQFSKVIDAIKSLDIQGIIKNQEGQLSTALNYTVNKAINENLKRNDDRNHKIRSLLKDVFDKSLEDTDMLPPAQSIKPSPILSKYI